MVKGKEKSLFILLLLFKKSNDDRNIFVYLEIDFLIYLESFFIYSEIYLLCIFKSLLIF